MTSPPPKNVVTRWLDPRRWLRRRGAVLIAGNESAAIDSPVVSPPETFWLRNVSAAGTLAVAGLVLAGRLTWLQVVEREEFGKRAVRQSVAEEETVPRPGDIHDRTGRLLATSVQTSSLYIVPSRIRERWTVAGQLADALELNRDALYERIASHRHFLWVKRRLSEEELKRVQALKLPSEVWGLRAEYQRVYPLGSLAAHVLGLRDVDGIGHGGVEQQFQEHLRGKPGKRRLVRDSRGRVIELDSTLEVRARDGQPIQLTLDAVVQQIVEVQLDAVMTAWQPEGCSAIALDPATGQVLAMASRPAYDPNNPAAPPPGGWKNRAISAIHEPGSTIKPLIVAHALHQDAIHRDEVFNCEYGQYRMGRRVLHDHHAYGRLSLVDVLVKSSNIGMAKIGERMTNAGLYEATVAFGFGRPTGIELPGELPGILRPLDKWNGYSTGSIPMGHELAMTPLQLIVGHAALANHGVWQQPRLVLPTDSSAEDRSVQQRVVSAEIADWIVQEPMTEVVRRGTGTRAKLPDRIVFGKTGTAQALTPEGSYRSDRYVSSFLGGSPPENPRLLVLVVVDQAAEGSEQFGGKVAAPAVAAILKQSLDYLDGGSAGVLTDRPEPSSRR
jgi:cell division protein FtsI/penicillin-binding protein 2